MDESQLWTLAGVVGMGVGALLGIDGLVVALMCSGNFRKYRRFVIVNLRVWTYMGLSGVLGGAVLLFGRYPRAIWYSCVLAGVVLLTLGLILRRIVDRKMQQIEEKHSRLMDFRR